MVKAKKQKVSKDMDILKFLEMEGFGSDRLSTISKGDIYHVRLKTSISGGYGKYDGKYHYRTIGEFRKIVEGRGYISGTNLRSAPRDFGLGTLNYFNDILKKRGIRPITPRKTMPREKKHSK